MRVRSSHRANFRFKFKKADKLTSNDTRITPLTAPCMSALVCACLHLSAPIAVWHFVASEPETFDRHPKPIRRLSSCDTENIFMSFRRARLGTGMERECSSIHFLAGLNSRCSALSLYFYDHCNVNTNPCQSQNPIGN